MDNLPPEIFNYLFEYLKTLLPHELYKLRRINKNFKKFIDDLKNTYNLNNLQKKIICNKFNTLINYDNYSINSYKWLFKNNVFFCDNNIFTLVLKNRLDIFKISLKYNENLDVIFSKDKYNLLSFGQHKKIILEHSPLILAGSLNNLDLIKFFLETKGVYSNPFHRQIDILIEILIEKNNKRLIKYLCTYHYQSMTGKMLTTQRILENLDNCEDLILYLCNSKKICINNNFILNSIKKGYTDTCHYAYKYIKSVQSNLNILIPNEHVNRIFYKRNTKLIDIWMEIFPEYFCYILKTIENIEFSKSYLYSICFNHIFHNYLDNIPKDFDIIKYYLLVNKNNLNESNIIRLINNDYIVTKDSLKLSLDLDEINIYRILNEKFLK